MTDWMGNVLWGPIKGFDSHYPREPLKHAIRLRGTLVRLHDKSRFWRGDEFFKTFEDGPWKWCAQARFAGKDANAGHYFALTEKGATAEADFYGADRTQLGLLELEIDLGGILDLTTMHGMYFAFEENVQNADFIEDDVRADEFVLNELIEIDKGGTVFTTRVGHWAKSNDYKGILFYGARATRPGGERTVRVDHGFITDPLTSLSELRREASNLNLVVFRGTDVISATKAYEIKPDLPRTENKYYGWTAEALDSVLQYGTDYQAERDRVTIFKISYGKRKYV